ncbi:hypothetical protein [Streptomyces sp. NPDC037389]|uniref:hypothetical protein n=1 Tax=Streptomyces sp. NPDC037389 TaxID=3155369 RepID=UPI0033CE7DDA
MLKALRRELAEELALSRERGGLDLGTGPVSLVLAVVIAASVGWLSTGERRAARAMA